MRTSGLGGRKRDHDREGRGLLPFGVGSAIFSTRAWEEIRCSLSLSARELQVVRRVFDDHTESAIAADLGISAHTVHTYLDRLHRKLGVVDRVQLVLRVTNEFLVLTVAGARPLPPICADRCAGRCPLRSG